MTERTDPSRVLTRLLGPSEPEVGCDVCFDELDRYEGRRPVLDGTGRRPTGTLATR